MEALLQCSHDRPCGGPEAKYRGRCLVQETKQVFEKLHKYVGRDIKTLVDRPDASYVIRLQKGRVFYVREDIMRRATNVTSAAANKHPPISCSRFFKIHKTVISPLLGIAAATLHPSSHCRRPCSRHTPHAAVSPSALSTPTCTC